MSTLLQEQLKAAQETESALRRCMAGQNETIIKLEDRVRVRNVNIHRLEQTNAALTADRKKLEAEVARLKDQLDLRVGPVGGQLIVHGERQCGKTAMVEQMIKEAKSRGEEVHRACAHRELELTSNPLEMKVTTEYWQKKYEEQKRLRELEGKVAADQVASLQRKLEMARRDVCASEAPMLLQEIADLRRWKNEALVVLGHLDFQVIGKELGIGLGKDVAQNILPGIRDLKAQLEGARARAVQESEELGKHPANRFSDEIRQIMDGVKITPTYTLTSGVQAMKLAYESMLQEASMRVSVNYEMLHDRLDKMINQIRRVIDGSVEKVDIELVARIQRLMESNRAHMENYNEAQKNYESACKQIAEMHEAATGRKGEAPKRGVVEDIADLKAERDQLLNAARRPLTATETISKTLAFNDFVFLLGVEILTINKANGWDVTKPSDWPAGKGASDSENTHRLRKIGTNLALIHSEVSEALEAVRKLDRQNFEEELADVIIRVLDTSHGLGINLGPVISAKLEKNRGRGHRHGGKAI